MKLSLSRVVFGSLLLVGGLLLWPGLGGSAPRRAAVVQMPSPRAAHSATLLADGRVLIAGGCRADGCEEGLSNDALVFEPSTGRFTRTGALLEPRAGHRALALADGTVLVLGGFTARGVTSTVERYLPETGTFERHGQLLTARDGATATQLADGTILITGGYGDGMRRLASAERYDVGRRRSVALPDMSSPRMSHTATLLPDGRVLVVGGSDSRSTVQATLEVFDPSTGTFSSAGRLEKARHKHAAISLGDEVWILGGAAIPERAGHFPETEVWSLRTGAVRRGPVMREGRYKFLDSVVALADGRVLVAGSGSVAEVLSADRRSFSVVRGPLGGKLAFSTATSLRDGRVLVLGGYDPAIRVSDQARLLAL